MSIVSPLESKMAFGLENTDLELCVGSGCAGFSHEAAGAKRGDFRRANIKIDITLFISFLTTLLLIVRIRFSLPYSIQD